MPHCRIPPLLALLALLTIASALRAEPAPAPAAPAPAAAAPTTPEPSPKPLDPRAADLKRTGDDAMQSLRYTEALRAYRAAFDIDPAPQLLYNMGRAQQAMGRYPDALTSLERFRTEAPPELLARVPRLEELIQEVRAQVTEVTIASKVDGARVLVRQEVIGKTPFASPVRLNAGPADIEVTADGFAPFRKRLDLPAGGALTVPVDLERLSNRGLLVVRSPVEGAVVFIDGKRAGTAPTEAVLVAGRHSLVLRREGYDEAESSVVVQAGERHQVDVPLAETPAITERWWFWVGTGAVVAGGVVLSVALLTERDPDSGTIPPGQLGTALSF